jgi:hypothetical protein
MRRASARILGALVVTALVAASRRAEATPDFPAVVVQTLGLPQVTIDPPQGCRLCHTTDQGGTSLRPFGTLMQQYGAQPYQPSSVQAALAAVEQNEPQLVDDIKAGRDPNDDTGNANVHTPEYGCGVARGGGPADVTLLAGTLVALRTWRAGRRRRGRSPG